MDSNREELEYLMGRRIIVLDGGMGTMIQLAGLCESDFRGERYANSKCEMKDCNDVLVLTRPDVVADIHRQYIDAGADIIMLDNMTHEQMEEAIRIIDGRAEVEVSGNVTKENIAKLTNLGVDYISSGALTHSSPILDLSLKNLHAI